VWVCAGDAVCVRVCVWVCAGDAVCVREWVCARACVCEREKGRERGTLCEGKKTISPALQLLFRINVTLETNGWMNIHMKRKTIKNINTFENRMLMLDGMPSVRVKTELLESEQGVSFQRCRPLLFMIAAVISRASWRLLAYAFFSQVKIIWDWLILIHLQPQTLLTWKRQLPETRKTQWPYKNHMVLS